MLILFSKPFVFLNIYWLNDAAALVSEAKLRSRGFDEGDGQVGQNADGHTFWFSHVPGLRW